MINIKTAFRHRYLVLGLITFVLGGALLGLGIAAPTHLNSFIISCGSFIAVAWTTQSPLLIITMLGMILLGMGLIRAFAFCLHEAARQRSLIRWVRLRETAEQRHRAYLPADVTVVRSSHPLALTRGILRPGIIISTKLIDLLSADELRVVLAHERVHVSRHDPARRIGWELLHQLFFFIPIISDLAATAIEHHEIIADRNVIAARPTNYLHLTASVKKLLHSALLRPLAQVAAFDTMTPRLQWLAHPTDRLTFSFRSGRLLMTLFLLAALMSSMLMSVHAAAALPTNAPSCAALENRELRPAQSLQDVMNTDAFIRINFSPAP